MGFFDFLRRKPAEKYPLVARRARRSYDAAKHRPDLSGWTSANPGPNALINDIGTLRARSRDRGRNDTVGSAAISKTAAQILGKNGINPRFSAVPAKIRDRAQVMWDTWSLAPDTTGRISRQALIHQAVVGMLESGDSLIRRVPLTFDEFREFGTGVPLALQILESDYLSSDVSISDDGSGNRIVGGVILNPRGRVSAYRLYRQHPAELTFGARDSWVTDDVPAYDVAHLYVPRRPGQLRGVPHLHAALLTIFGLHDFIDADLVRRRAQATLAGVVRNSVLPPNTSEVGENEGGPDGALGPVAHDAYGNIMETIAPGSFAYLDGSEDITFTTPTGQADLPPTIKMFLRMVAASAGITYEDLSGDLEGVNYSSFRAGKISSDLALSALRSMYVLPVMTRIWGWFREAATAVDPEMEALPVIPTWAVPIMPSVEPQKDAEAAAIRVESGFSSISQEIEDMGGDPAEVAAQRKRDAVLFGVDSGSKKPEKDQP